jgi:hypothetical protein
MRNSTITHLVRVDGDIVSVREIGSDRPAIGRILGVECDDRERTYYVDRLLLPPGPFVLNDEWFATGAVSTVLHQRLSTAMLDALGAQSCD